ncbi:ATP-binding protein [Streptomyces sp. NBC_01089]|uniref:ATP-binding protein n=1 Tax=Streptomyces sp. NBC_01089 TaxID=2903747 RepID=UPI003862D8A2|nr:ATP-binding protein [Streptomyces sp. NBC_01089]
MAYCSFDAPRRDWQLAFLAVPEEVARLRGALRHHLDLWGLSAQVDAAQLCVSELTANVIKHVGAGTPTTLAVSTSGTCLRIEVRDPDSRALPTLLSPDADSEGGRGMALVDALAERWGVLLSADCKITWCELATPPAVVDGHVPGCRVERAEALLDLHGKPAEGDAVVRTRLSLAFAEEAVADVITDLLHWLRAHGCDPEATLDRAQIHFEAETQPTA